MHVHAKSVYSAGAYAAEDMQIRIYFQRQQRQHDERLHDTADDYSLREPAYEIN